MSQGHDVQEAVVETGADIASRANGIAAAVQALADAADVFAGAALGRHGTSRRVGPAGGRPGADIAGALCRCRDDVARPFASSRCDGDHPYCKNWWVPGLQLGYEHSFVHQVADFIKGVESGKLAEPTFKAGLATDYVTDAVLKSARTGKWEKVKKVKGS